MLRRIWAIVKKEIRENLRDRRTFLTAFIFGPLGSPLFFAFLMNATVQHTVNPVDKPLVLAISGAQSAPNLIAYLRSQNILVKAFEGDSAAAQEAIRSKSQSLILSIPAHFAETFIKGEPSMLELYEDNSDSGAKGDQGRLTSIMRQYSGQIAGGRLQLRGVPTSLVQPIILDEIDVSTPVTRALLVLRMVSFFVLFATLMGGLYVAIDSTAGERERGSLEPLLTAPIERGHLVLGKILATAFFMTLALSITILAFSVSLRFVKFSLLGMTLNFSPKVALSIFGIMWPIVLPGAAFMTLVASFTRTYREAQSWLAALLMVPGLPIIIAAVYELPMRMNLVWIPSLGQHLLIQAVLRGDPVPVSGVIIASSVTLSLGAFLTALTMRLYQRDGILG